MTDCPETTDRPTARELIREALHDAVQWQESFAASWPAGSPERAEALAQAKEYRAILKRRYGSRLTPIEQRMAGASTITLDELRKRHHDR